MGRFEKKRVFFMVLVPLVCCLLLFQISTAAASVPQRQWYPGLLELLTRTVQAALPQIHEPVINEVRGVAAITSRLPADCQQPSFVVEQLGSWNRTLGKVPVQVRFSVPAGRTCTCWLSVFLSGKCQAYIAGRTFDRGTVVRYQDVRRTLVDIRQVGEDALVEFSQEALYEAARKVTAGQLLTTTDIRPHQLVKRGDQVAVLLQREGVRIVTKGTAMASGSIDEVIMVKNPTSRHLYQARIINAGRVKVLY
ncbi:MAG: flagellar basal body P-ring formation protein FlgA [Deltaproteobacteria bacterium]|nr:flagellar basal body P-ring formation protein FlgA [Candidatus Anaeroferrophillus wilburensis]MBN2889604.1 flagellar basal body P-ring formation protein FlgA [Deltaproteobacteria bacterium]